MCALVSLPVNGKGSSERETQLTRSKERSMRMGSKSYFS